jgi:hypothetical protein
MKVSFANKCEQKLSPIVSNNFCSDSQFSLLTALPPSVADMDFVIPMLTGKAKLQDAAQFAAYPMQSFQNYFRAAGATGVTHGNRMRHDRGDSSGLSPTIPEWNAAE